MVKVGILGATGYAGEELITLLLGHPEVVISYLAAKVDKPQKIGEIFPKFAKRLELVCDNFDFQKAQSLCDVVFLALPHTVSMDIVPALLKKKKLVIDLSADYRFKDISTYEHWYKVKHKDALSLKKAIYGLPELYRENIKKADFISNPGCYPTAAILALAPIVVSGKAELDSIIIDAKSGVTGAGRRSSIDFSFAELNEDFKAYRVNAHQHSPEINQELSKLACKKISVNFVPHLLPLNRGILETIYLKVAKKGNSKTKDFIDLYKKFYKLEPFVRIKEEGTFPRIKDVVGTNYCDIGMVFDEDKSLLIIISAIDNLVKGASGQALQNMNIVLGYKESTGLL